MILLISDNLPPVIGGSATVYDQICRLNPTRIVALTSRNTYRSEAKPGSAAYDEACGYQIYRIDNLRVPIEAKADTRPLASLRSFAKEMKLIGKIALEVRAICRRHAVDTVCIGELVYGGPIGIVAKYLLRKRVVIYCHGEEITQDIPTVVGRLRGFFLRHCDRIVAVSLFCKGEIIGRYGIRPEKIAVIANGVDLDRFTPGQARDGLVRRFDLAGARVIVAMGRLIERKGFDQLIAAFRRVLLEVPNARLLVAGDGPDRPRLEALVAQSGLGDTVRFTGRVDDADVPEIYRLADVFAMPNRTMADGDTEGFGLVFLEASACGKPVVGGTAGGAIEGVIDGETGFSVDGNDAHAIASALVTLLTDRPRAERMSKAGLLWAQRSTWARRAAEFAQIAQRQPEPATGIDQRTRTLRASKVPIRSSDGTAAQPRLYLTIDFEESFDWNNVRIGPPLVKDIDNIRAFQRECAAREIWPTYFSTYRILSDSQASAFLRATREAGACDVGMHPHPWATPPLLETPNDFNTFQGNLPEHLELAKLSRLAETYRQAMGVRPRMHRAGRYGATAQTYKILESLGVYLDFSPSADFDFGRYGGPDFRGLSNFPARAGPAHKVLCVPVPSGRFLKGPDALSWIANRLRIRRVGVPVRLSPENNTVPRMKIIADNLIASGQQDIVVTLHSTSLMPRGNPYSETEADVNATVTRLLQFIEWMRHAHGARCCLPSVEFAEAVAPS